MTLKVLFVADAGAALTRLNLPCDMDEEEDDDEGMWEEPPWLGSIHL